MKTCHKYSIINTFLLFCLVLLPALSVCIIGTTGYAATLIVTNTNDSGAGSLRQAISDAAGGDVISFYLTYPSIITLAQELEISKDLTIQGPVTENLSISGNHTCRVFHVTTEGTVAISGLSIVNGNGGDFGGGIRNVSSYLTVTNCTFSGGSAINGGGICNIEGNPIIMNCTFKENDAIEGGGIANLVNSCPQVIGCTFSDNHADYGGGIYNNWYNSPPITNCTFSNNTGGAIYSSWYSYSEITNCTFFGNDTGIINYEDCDPIIKNCIFWNLDGEVENYYPSSQPTISYCVVQSDDYGIGSNILDGVISADPMLAPLADNGGPTWTCALLPDSSAIDTGNSDGAPATDQRGTERPQATGYDIGAFEAMCYVINAYYNTGGNVSPESADVLEGDSIDFTFLPESGYGIWEVYVDGEPVSYDEVNLTYTFDNVSADHVISADFQPQEGSGSGGCSISVVPVMGLLLLVPVLFLSGKIK